MEFSILMIELCVKVVFVFQKCKSMSLSGPASPRYVCLSLSFLMSYYEICESSIVV